MIPRENLVLAIAAHEAGDPELARKLAPPEKVKADIAELEASLFPEEGCTRCHCGAKYWDGLKCASCGEIWDGTDQT